jgi:SAM-dependent methyltransferase
LLNLGTYVAAIQTWPSLGATPVIPLAIGAALGLLFNFTAARALVYGQSSTRPRPVIENRPVSSYSGRENLEAMKHARNYNRFLLDLVKEHAPDGITLDFGAGAGTFALPLSQAGKNVICIEPDDDLRLSLQTSGLKAFSGIEAIAPRSADYIYTLNVLEHIQDDGKMLDTLSSRLRPGGVLLVYVPAFEVLFSAMDEQVGHFRRYRMRALKDLIADTGLVVTRAAYVDCLGFLAALLYRAIGSSGTISAASVRAYDRVAFPISRLADRLFSPVCGKNLLIVARKPS